MLPPARRRPAAARLTCPAPCPSPINPIPPSSCCSSLRHLKKEVAERLAAKQAAAPAGFTGEGYESDGSEGGFYISTAVSSWPAGAHEEPAPGILPALLSRPTALPCPSLRLIALPQEAGGAELADKLGALSLEGGGAHGPLRGLPTPVGQVCAAAAAAGLHLLLADDGVQVCSSSGARLTPQQPTLPLPFSSL